MASHSWKGATCTAPKTCTKCGVTEGDVIECEYVDGVCRFCGKVSEAYANVLIISDTQTISDQTIDKDIYITSTGVVTLQNVVVNGNIYCYGQLTCSGCTANDVYAYAYGSMMSCKAFDGVHGKVSGRLKCNTMSIVDEALDYAFEQWGKR